uniref:G-protein-signaling modulator 2 n=2 Tax=Trichuris muris TaxID=70415 RepID=A0A5S6R0X2_TRIMR
MKARPIVETDSVSSNQFSCADLVREGERRCNTGDLETGISCFEMAITIGTDDVKVLSAIYSQLGNAYFYKKNLNKALEYQRYDLMLARAVSDVDGEASASGNIGCTLKALGRYDEALRCCQRYLELSQLCNKQEHVAAAYYNLGGVYCDKAKNLNRERDSDITDYSQRVRELFLKAVQCYEMSLKITRELGNRLIEGRVCGNLGNTYYLLGDFRAAIDLHTQRLNTAIEFGDKYAMRRAYTNLGNASVFLGDVGSAVEYYRKAIQLAKELKAVAVEAQAYYSLGHCFTILEDHKSAVKYHLRHLSIARSLKDEFGQERAAWSLSNALIHLRQPRKALHFMLLHYSLAKQLGDRNGEMIAELNFAELLRELSPDSLPDSSLDPHFSGFNEDFIANLLANLKNLASVMSSKDSANDVLSSDGSHDETAAANVAEVHVSIDAPVSRDTCEQDAFFDHLFHVQSKRLDDQRCDANLISTDGESRNVEANPFIQALADRQDSDDLLNLIAGMQSRRMDDQRADLPFLPGLQEPNCSAGENPNSQQAGVSRAMLHPAVGSMDLSVTEGVACDELLMVNESSGIEMSQDSRIEDQQSAVSSSQSVTIPDEHFFRFLWKLQARRLDEQRAHLQLLAHWSNSEKKDA